MNARHTRKTDAPYGASVFLRREREIRRGRRGGGPDRIASGSMPFGRKQALPVPGRITGEQLRSVPGPHQRPPGATESRGSSGPSVRPDQLGVLRQRQHLLLGGNAALIAIPGEAFQHQAVLPEQFHGGARFHAGSAGRAAPRHLSDRAAPRSRRDCAGTRAAPHQTAAR